MQQLSFQDAVALGKSAQQAGDFTRARAIYEQILVAAPEHPEVLHLLGLVELQSGQLEQARGLIERAIKGFGGAAHFHANLGLVFVQLGEWEQAIEAYERALSLHADFPQAREALAGVYAKWGELLHDRGDIERAVEIYRKSLRLRPEDVQVLNNLGAGLLELSRPGEAIEPLQQALTLKPDHGDARVNLGTVWRDLHRFDEAVQAFESAAATHPGWYAPESALGIVKLLQEDFAAGWKLLERRWGEPSLAKIRASYTQPQWLGEPLNGRLILLYGEQGLGDVIQFIRYVPMVIERGGRVIVACDPPLVALLSANFPAIEQWVSPGAPIPAHDFQSSLMSLPMVFDSTVQTIPARVPYLRADAQIAERWRERLAGLTGGRKVGLAWAGRAKHLRDRSRSIPPTLLQPLSQVQGLSLVSLQVGRPNDELKFQISDFTADLTDFQQTAGLIEQLDLVITVDTAVAHLAGAMGKPVWVLIQFSPDWRWMLHRTDSPWYPTMRLFRQPEPGDWSSPINTMVDMLRQQGCAEDLGGLKQR